MAFVVPAGSFAITQPITTKHLLSNLRKGEPWDRGVLTATKTVLFQQAASGGTDASSILKVTLRYFTSSNCSGSAIDGPDGNQYTTPDGTSFPISIGTSFGLVATSAWSVGSGKLGIQNMTAVQSIAVTLKSTNNNTPQANFSGNSFACIPVTCTAGPAGECTSGLSTQSFQLKTTAALGDPADGGVIACMNGGLNDLVVPASDNSTGIQWGGEGNTTNATSTTDGATNTTTIVASLNPAFPAAARTCTNYSAQGGFTTGWFLPAGNNTTSSGQLNCLYANRSSIGGFDASGYWSSTESSANGAYSQNFSDGSQNILNKTTGLRVRCARSFTS